MDTEDKYLGDSFYVVMAGELPPDFVVEAMEENHRKRVENDDSSLVGPKEWEPSPAKENHIVGEQPEVDGWVTFYDPDLLEQGEPFKHGTFPFRSVEKDGAWFARPDGDKWSRSPIWEWKNPTEDPSENLTLSPSIGLQGDGEITFHCHIRDGEIDWI